MQTAPAPTEFEKYSTLEMDPETMSNAGYSMVAYGPEETARYFNLEGYKARAAEEKTATPKKTSTEVVKAEGNALQKVTDRTVKTAGITAPEKPAKPTAAVSGDFVVGINQRAELFSVAKLWQTFSSDSQLTGQLRSNTFTVLGIYSDFNQQFTEAQVTIGFLNLPINGKRYTVPTGKQNLLLAKGNHSISTMTAAWNKIDFSRPIKAVLERRDFNGDQETVALSVIYR
ncbi:hypothetical protein ACWJJH_18430 [Endozoicomonadaceae bacterium StTr2]